MRVSDLTFRIASAQANRHAACPTVAFALHISATPRVEALVLRAQVRIEPQWRTYGAAEELLLNDLFGTPDRWGTTLRALSWADVSITVPGFEDQTQVELPVACTYDFDFAATRFFNALGEGEIPLRFLFSGAIFRSGPGGFSTERISWSSECAYRMPLAVWHEAMRACYGEDALIRVSVETFKRLHSYRVAAGVTTWDDLFARMSCEAPT